MKSLGTRIAFVISAVLFLLVFIAGMWIDRQLTKSIYDEEIRQTKVHASTLLASLQILMLNGQGTLAREWLDRMVKEEGIVNIEVLRRDGKEAFTDIDTIGKVNAFIQQERFHRDPVAPERSAPLTDNSFQQALQGQTTIDLTMPGQIAVYMPIMTDNECLACHGYDLSPQRGVLKLGLSNQLARERIATMRKNLWGVSTLLVGLLGLALWGALRFSVLRPIGQLIEAIIRVGRGDRDTKLLIDRNDELGEVSALFNRMQEQLLENESRIRAVTDNVVDAIITIDEKGNIVSANPAVEKIFGYKIEELLGKNVSVLMPEPHGSKHDEYLDNYLRTGITSILGKGREITGKHRDGSEFPMDIAVSEMKVGDSRHYIGIMRDITERKEQVAALEYQALHDTLTGLPNRALLADRLMQAIRASERSGAPLGLLIMDLDRFKEINDTLGHHFGDEVLKEISRRMKEVLRVSDTVARLGGDEFAVLLPTADIDHATKIARKLLRTFEIPFVLEGHNFLVGASIGIALYPEHGSDESALMRRADVAMYVAKRGNRGYMVYESKQDQHNIQSFALMSDLRAAIDNDELVLYYQPVINLQRGAVTGIEALLRWQHPTKGLLYPDDFIPAAEMTSLIRALTLWVLKKATEQSLEWTNLGIELRVAVNLSVHNLHDPQFPDQVAEIVRGGGIQMSRLRLEITETAIMSDPARALEILNQLSAMGVRISIDDFGTGYSSLSYLKQLPVDEIKIDKSFVTGMTEDDNDVVIVRSTVDLAHNIGLKVVAEGVENQATFEMLVGLHCDSAQGFHMGEPMAAEVLSTWLNDSPWGISKG